ncbi:SDR family NAD(P)-dependent oxidoreductase [Lacticaseibacillus pabuli]|uniref:SDR family NAD(P)-dependent oxidoreductase n=1 Tax=Lacticaseibacillus pabuli TaxID=3025672 RepID=A0ABY7WSR7_9LACO|nr:SDR family NAD(P)-dependent oxidoreductase [Lacticaseibacillus sp. KACC 23028]WDF83219.1 SDR family NAD(P)-dependent oxidoreductase [Lacticaseibacillus sp. KACC 23028]
MLKKFKGKTAFITGAASGFGKAFATEASHRGMNLALVDIDGKRLKEVAESLSNTGAEVLAITGDVSLQNVVDDAVKTAMTKFGQIDLLINDAGIVIEGNVWELPPHDMQWILDANVMSQVYTMHDVIPIMQKQGTPAHILNVASMAGLLTIPGMPAYHTSKFAAVGLSESTALDLETAGIDNVGMSVFTPGFVQTDLYHSQNHRPERFQDPDNPYYQSNTYKDGEKWMKKCIETGHTIASVVKPVFDAIENDTFYILTDSGYEGELNARAQRILDGTRPSV